MNNKHTCLAADDFTEAAWGRLEVGFQNWKAASFMAEIPALQVIPPSCWGNQFAKWKPGSLYPPLTNNWTSFPFSCLVMGAEEGGEGLKLQWISIVGLLLERMKRGGLKYLKVQNLPQLCSKQQDVRSAEDNMWTFLLSRLRWHS